MKAPTEAQVRAVIRDPKVSFCESKDWRDLVDTLVVTEGHGFNAGFVYGVAAGIVATAAGIVATMEEKDKEIERSHGLLDMRKAGTLMNNPSLVNEYKGV